MTGLRHVGDAVDAPQWLADPVESGRAAGFGIYLHVPFCHHRCGYCDFATTAVGDGDSVVFDRYVAALAAQIDQWARQRAWPSVDTVFIGGGTPTLIGADRLGAVLGRLRESFEVAPDAEVTVEANPEDASVDLFTALTGYGFTRVSMGVQSLEPGVLTTLERRHSPDRVGQAVEQARAGGVTNLNLDLIYGTPGETDEGWIATLRAVLGLGVEHVSAYALSIHANTPFGRAVAAGALPPVDDDTLRDRFDLTREALSLAGFDHYELSNFARIPALRSRHNVLYWRHGNYLGLGVGAHGHLDGHRWWTTRSTERFLDLVAAGRSPIAGSEDLQIDEQATERLMLGLRLREGLHPRDVPPIDPMALEDAMAADLIATSCGRVQATAHGWYLLDEAVTRLAG